MKPRSPAPQKPHSRAPSDIRLQLWIDHAHHWDTRLRAITSFLKKCITKSHITPPNKLHQVAGSHPITCHRPINDPVTSQVLGVVEAVLGKDFLLLRAVGSRAPVWAALGHTRFSSPFDHYALETHRKVMKIPSGLHDLLKSMLYHKPKSGLSKLGHSLFKQTF